jgi:hypothetical protein
MGAPENSKIKHMESEEIPTPSTRTTAILPFLKLSSPGSPGQCPPKGTDYMFAHPDEAAEVGAKELRTTVANARRAIEDTAKMDIMSRDCRSYPQACRVCLRTCRRTTRSAATCRSAVALRRRWLPAGKPSGLLRTATAGP